MNQIYDAFTEGTTLGGMRTKNDIRILLCYMLRSVGAPFSRSACGEALSTTELANFFEVNDALAALTKAGLAALEKRDDDDYFILTPAGREAVERLAGDLPQYARNTAAAAAVALKMREKARAGTSTRIEKLDVGYHVILSLMDGDTLMMQTVLYAADSMQADSLCDAFSAHPEKLYSGILEALTR